MVAETGHIAGTTIARQGWAALIRGGSGAGKSDLALRAISHPIRLPGETALEPFQLISDDQTFLSLRNGTLFTSPPETLRGLIEVRGIGIVSVPSATEVPLALIVDLTETEIERLPAYPGQSEVLHGCSVDVVRVSPFEASAPIKIALALARSIEHRTSAN